jgi:hypothetical protein
MNGDSFERRKAREAEILRFRRAALERRRQARAERLERQEKEHKAMRDTLRGKTETTVNMLTELRVAHTADGHFINGHYVTGVSQQDAEVAMKRDSEPPR